MDVIHATIATGTDAGNGEIAKAQWNQAHSLSMATDKILGRTTAGVGTVEELAVGSGLLLASGTLSAVASATPKSLLDTWMIGAF